VANLRTIMVHNYTICPRGFVFPDHPNSTGVTWASGTNCAFSCARSPYTTQAAYDDQYSYGNVVGSVTLLVLSFLNILVLFKEGERSKMNYLFFIFFLTTVPISAVNVASHVINFGNNGAAFCVDNAVPYTSQRDELVPVCLAQSIVAIYFQLCATVTYLIITFDIFVLTVFGMSTVNLRKFFVCCIVAVPCLPLLTIFGTNYIGYFSPAGVCVNANTWTSMWIVPIVLLSIAAAFILCAVGAILKKARVNWKRRSFKFCLIELSALLSPPILFSILTFAAFCDFSSYRVYYNDTMFKAQRLMPAHVDCIFRHYDEDVGDESWIDVCGEGIPIVNKAIKQRVYANFFFYTQSIFFLIALLPTYTKQLMLRYKRLHSSAISSMTDQTALASHDYFLWRLMGWCWYCLYCGRNREKIAPVPSNDSELYEFVAELFRAMPGDSDELEPFTDLHGFPVLFKPAFAKPNISTNLVDLSGALESDVDDEPITNQRPVQIDPLVLL
jgi:hypothetical protein